MNFRFGLILAIMASASGHLSAQAYDFQGCNGCHGSTLDRDITRARLHSPFAKQQCWECHAATDVPQMEAPAKALPAVREMSLKIDWLGDSAMAATSHVFLVPGDKEGDILILDLQETDGRFSRREIFLPPLAALAEVEDDHQPPVISGVQTLKVQRGVFLSATIGWQTDTLTDSLVQYSGGGILQISEPGIRLGKRHEVVLYNLKPDRAYSYSVIATDLFGRRQTSAPFEFSTFTPFDEPLLSEPAGLQGEGSGGAGLERSFRRLGMDYLLELKLEQPALVYIGTRESSRRPVVTDDRATAMQRDDASHAGLSSEAVTSMGACRKCHQDQSTAAHPVNVYPRPGMTIPPEYPTLPDGRITCNSCHGLHGADHEYLTRKQGRRELCVGCHRNMM